MSYDYLNFLFTEKIQADKMIAEIEFEEKQNNPLPAASAERIIELRTTKKTFWQHTASGWESAIKKYLDLHPVK